jgi:hypothetical protein
LVDYGLIYKYEKLLIQALYYAARNDMSAVDKFLALFISPDLAKQFKTFLENLCSLDEHELDQTADKAARISTENHGYDGFLFLGGLFNIVCMVTKNFIL